MTLKILRILHQRLENKFNGKLAIRREKLSESQIDFEASDRKRSEDAYLRYLILMVLLVALVFAVSKDLKLSLCLLAAFLSTIALVDLQTVKVSAFEMEELMKFGTNTAFICLGFCLTKIAALKLLKKNQEKIRKELFRELK